MATKTRTVFLVSEEKWTDGLDPDFTLLAAKFTFEEARAVAQAAAGGCEDVDHSTSYRIEAETVAPGAEIPPPGRAWRWFAAIEADFQEITLAVPK